jgi:hypothetical protein
MNKIQIFHGISAPELTKTINAWLEANKVGTVKSMTQSESQTGTAGSILTITILY